MKSRVGALVGSIVLLLACGNKMQTREAVERGILKGVAPSGIKSDSMDVHITDLKFHGNKADAVVAFVPKGGRISDGIVMRYGLEQRDGEWVIVSRSGMDMKQHAGGMTTPPSMMDGNSGAVDPMPNAIPGVAPSSRPLPPGHPPLHDGPSGTPQ